jgi:hypothetical protein
MKNWADIAARGSREKIRVLEDDVRQKMKVRRSPGETVKTETPPSMAAATQRIADRRLRS